MTKQWNFNMWLIINGTKWYPFYFFKDHVVNYRQSPHPQRKCKVGWFKICICSPTNHTQDVQGCRGVVYRACRLQHSPPCSVSFWTCHDYLQPSPYLKIRKSLIDPSSATSHSPNLLNFSCPSSSCTSAGRGVYLTTRHVAVSETPERNF